MPNYDVRLKIGRYSRAVDSQEFLQILRRRGLVILLCVVAGIGGGYYAGHSGSKQYKATAQCIVNIPAASTLTEQLAGAQLTSGLVATYARIATSRSVARQVASSLQVQGLPLSTVGGLSASAEVGNDIIDVTATSDTAQGAAAVANAASHALITTVANLQRDVDAPVTIQVVDPATPPGTPVSPKPRSDLILGLVLGILAGIGLAALLESLDHTVRSTAQLTAMYDAPLLSTVPRRRRFARRSMSVAAVAEPYRILRSALLYLNVAKSVRTIAVTSPSKGDGKTRTVASLAYAIAASGETVIAVDGDLRSGSLAEAFQLGGDVGLTSVLFGSSSLTDALQEVAPGLRVLGSGPLPPNPSELLGTDRFSEILHELAASADKVVIDSSPVGPVADAVILAAKVDGVIVVIRHGHTGRKVGKESVRRLVDAQARILGYVYNAAMQPGGRSSYGGRRRHASVPELPAPSKRATAPRRSLRREPVGGDRAIAPTTTAGGSE